MVSSAKSAGEGGERTLGGRYALREQIAETDFSLVFAADDAQAGRRVCVKLLRPERLVDNPEVLLRFRREAEILSRLSHPHVVKVLDFGASEAGTPYLVMELLEGEPLDARLEGEPLAVSEAVRVLRELVDGLAHVHRQGVLHLDIKPGNIFMAGEGERASVRLVDFGFAGDKAGVSEGAVAGTLRYMAPEQAGLLRRPVGAPADLYSVGCVAFELLAGRPPFEGEHLGHLLRQIQCDTPPLVRALAPEVPAVLEQMIATLLRKNPDDRYQATEGLLVDLQRLERALDEGGAAPSFALSTRGGRLSEKLGRVFVGRSAALGQARGVAARAAAGRPQLLVVRGETGCGKTAFVDELVSGLQAEGAELARGTGSMIHTGRGYAALEEALGAVLGLVERRPAEAREAALRALRERLGDRAPDLARLSAAWGSALGVQESAAPYAGEVAERERTSAVVTELLSVAAPAEGVLVLFLDDLQWADARAVELLTLLLDRLEGERVLLIAAYRDDEVSDDHPVTRLRDADDPRVLHLSLGDLHEDEIADLVERLTGAAPPAPLLRALRERSGGNAFFLWELIRAYLRAGVIDAGEESRFDLDALEEVQLPTDLIEVVVGRLEALPDELRRILGVAALFGRPFGFADLRAALAIEEARLYAALVTALDGQLIAPDEGRTYAFAHDKVRDACAAFLTGDERAARHRAIAAWLEARAPEGDASAELIFDLAFHHRRAGDPAAALPHLRRAARTALELHQNERAVELYEEALALLDELGRPEDDDERLHLAAREADALDAMGRYEASAERYRRALEATEDPLESARLLAKLAHGCQKRGRFGEMHANLVRALRLLGVNVRLQGPRLAWSVAAERLKIRARALRSQASAAEYDDERFSLVAEILTRLWYFHSFYDLGKNNVKMVYLAHKLLGLALQRGPSRELAIAHRTMSITLCQGAKPDFEEALRHAFRGVEVARGLGAQMELAEALSYVGMVYVWHARSDMAVEYLERARRLFEQIGNKWEMANVHIFLFMARFSTGNIEAALGHAFEIVKIGKRASAAGSMASGLYKVGEMLCLQGEVENGERYLARAVAIAEENELQFDLYMALKTRGRLHLRAGRFEEGRADFERAIELNEDNNFMRAYVADGTIGWSEAVVRAQLASGRVHRGGGELRRAKERLDDAVDAEERSRLHLVAALRVRALLHLARDDRAAAEAEAERALEIAQAEGRAIEIPLCLEVLADIALRVDRERARALLRQARDAWREYGAGAEVERAESRLRELGGAPASEGDRDALAQAQRQAEALLRVSLASSSQLDADEQARSALDELIEVMGADRALLFGIDDEGELELLAGRHREGGDIATPVGSSSTVVKRARDEQRAVVVTGDDQDGLGSKSAILYDLRSIMAAPLMVRDRMLGVVYLDNHLDRGIRTQQDAQLLQAIANHIAISMETTRTARLELERQALEKERALLAQNLALTGTVQALFLPAEGAHELGAARVAGVYRSADESGGDFWWLSEVDGRARVLIADVTGHGAAAAMLTASMAAVIRHAQRAEPPPSCPELARSLHEVLADLSQGEYLMTLALLEVEAGVLRLWNAGAPPLLVHRAGGKLDVVAATGVPVGGPRFALEAVEIELGPGDRALAYTDGVVEQPVATGRAFGRKQLARAFTRQQGSPLDEVGPGILARLDEARGEAAQDDDHTLVLLELAE